MGKYVKLAEIGTYDLAPEDTTKYYTIIYTKVVKDINGIEVEIPDRTEVITLENLEAKKAEIQDTIDKISIIK